MEMIGMGSIRVWVQDNLKIVTGPGIDTLKPVRRQIAHRRSIRTPPALDVYPSAIFKVEGAYIDGVGKAVFGNTPARPHPAGITADVGNKVYPPGAGPRHPQIKGAQGPWAK